MMFAQDLTVITSCILCTGLLQSKQKVSSSLPFFCDGKTSVHQNSTVKWKNKHNYESKPETSSVNYSEDNYSEILVKLFHFSEYLLKNVQRTIKSSDPNKSLIFIRLNNEKMCTITNATNTGPKYQKKKVKRSRKILWQHYFGMAHNNTVWVGHVTIISCQFIIRQTHYGISASSSFLLTGTHM